MAYGGIIGQDCGAISPSVLAQYGLSSGNVNEVLAMLAGSLKVEYEDTYSLQTPTGENVTNKVAQALNIGSSGGGWELIQNWTAQNQYWSINLSSDYREYMIIFTNNNSTFSCPCVRNENNNVNGAIYTKWVTQIPSGLKQLFGSQTYTNAIYAGDPGGTYVGGFIRFTLSGTDNQKILVNSTMFPNVSSYSTIIPIMSYGYLTGNTFLMAVVNGSSISYAQYNASLYGLK